MHPSCAHHAEVWRLLQIDLEDFVQRVIEVSIARRVFQVGDHRIDMRIELRPSEVDGNPYTRGGNRQMGQPADVRLTDQLARDVCVRVNGQMFLTPSIASLDGHYLIALLANDGTDGHALSARRKEVNSKRDVLSAFSEMLSSVRRDAGESRASLRKFDKPFFEEKTSSLEALKAYSEAERMGDAGNYKDSVALFRHAIELDPQFTIAYADMGSMCYNLGDAECSKTATSKAYALRDTVTSGNGFISKCGMRRASPETCTHCCKASMNGLRCTQRTILGLRTW